MLYRWCAALKMIENILNHLVNWGLTPQEAINLPNFGSNNGPEILEENRFNATTVEALKARGHEFLEINMTSDLQAIQRTNSGLQGGADSRH